MPRLTEEQKKDYIDHGLKAIKQVHELHRNTIKKILVTADSNLFLSKAVEVFPFAYAIPGKVVHMDAESGKSYKLHEREFLDYQKRKKVTLINMEKCSVQQGLQGRLHLSTGGKSKKLQIMAC